jgi:hypothetical protein
MEKFNIRGPRISGRFYPDNDINRIYFLLCNIQDNIDFAKRRPDHEKTPEFLRTAFNKCMMIIEILDTDKPTEE